MTQHHELAGMIDHTLLKPDATGADFARLCDEAIEHRFCSVCVPGSWVAFARGRVAGRVKVAAVVGFPHGNARANVKAFEAWQAIADGADEIDMVMQVGRLRAGERDAVADDIAAVVKAADDATDGAAVVKVILETALLRDDEKRAACTLAMEAGAHFVKTSTGFSGGGATAEDVRLMRSVVGDRLGVKASGGIRTAADARAMIAAGANRLGCSASVAIVTGAAGAGGY